MSESLQRPERDQQLTHGLSEGRPAPPGDDAYFAGMPMSIWLERWEWQARDNRVAAAVLGHQAGMLVWVHQKCLGHSLTSLGEMERIAVDLAKEAAHYGLLALEGKK